MEYSHTTSISRRTASRRRKSTCKSGELIFAITTSYSHTFEIIFRALEASVVVVTKNEFKERLSKNI